MKLKSKSLARSTNGFLRKVAMKGMSFKAALGRDHLQHLKMAPGSDLQATIAELQADPDVEYAEPNYILTIDSLNSSDNLGHPQALSQEAMASTIQGYSIGSYAQTDLDVGVNQAWSQVSASGDRPIVAVLDTGIDYNHNVFLNSNALWVNSGETPNDGIDNDGNGYIDDIHGWNFYAANNRPWDDDGHGTHVSGIVVGTTLDIFAPTLEESKVQIMALKFLGADGSGDTASAIQAIDYAIAKGAKVINASWGGSSYSRALHEAFARAYDHGILIAAAAGNFSSSNDKTAIYPANFNIPGLVSVAASNNTDILASFSNYGLMTVHLAAPGDDVRSTYPYNTFARLKGTSMATPFVAGVGALLLREAPQLSGYQVRQILLQTVSVNSNLSPKVISHGRIGIVGALAQAKSMVSTATYLPSYTVTVPAREIASEQASSSSSGGGGGCGSIALVRALSEGNGLPPSEGGGGSGSSSPGPFGAMGLLFVPLVLWALIRNSLRPKRTLSSWTSSFEKRFSQRLEIEDRVVVRNQHGETVVQMKNLSKGGLAIRYDGHQWGHNEKLSLIFTDRKTGAQIEVDGRIAWIGGGQEAGIQFQWMNECIQRFFLRSYA